MPRPASTPTVKTQQNRALADASRRVHGRVAGITLACIGATMWGASCTMMLDFPDQCLTDADCAQEGFSLDTHVCELGICRNTSENLPDEQPNSVSEPSRSGVAAEPASKPVTSRPESTSVDKTISTDDRDEAPPPAPMIGADPAASDDADAEAASMVDVTPPTSPSVDSPMEVAPECEVDNDCAELASGQAKCIANSCWPLAMTCSADTDCEQMGPEYLGGRCFEQLCEPNPRFRCAGPGKESPDKVVRLSVLVRDSLSLKALAGIEALVCQKLDVQCAAPDATIVTDEEGMLRFEVPENFSGYLQTSSQDYFPALYFIPPTLPEDGELQPYPLLPGGIIVDGLAFSLGTRLDPKRGHMMLISEDCQGEALPGVSFSSDQADKDTIQFYVRDLLPTPAETETAEIGNGGYLNFPAGNAIIDLTLNETGLRLTTSTVVVRPGFISVAYIRPEPHVIVVP